MHMFCNLLTQPIYMPVIEGLPTSNNVIITNYPQSLIPKKDKPKLSKQFPTYVTAECI
jgi:hypothetical protein